jgi:hypothetical protein
MDNIQASKLNIVQRQKATCHHTPEIPQLQKKGSGARGGGNIF